MLDILAEVEGDGTDDFFCLFFLVALSTASMCGYCMTHGATTMLVSVLVLAAFFCLFLGGPLQST
jgi:hypothetical protein